MNTIIAILAVSAVALFLCAHFKLFPALKFSLGKYRIALANDGALTVGVHAGGRVSGYHDDAPVTVRFLLVKQGSADNHWALPTSVIDMPVGVCTDEPAATTDPVNFILLNAAGQTVRMVAAGAIAAGAIVVTNGDGYVKTLPSTSGVYWQVGVAVTTTTTSGDLVEVQPCIQQVGVNLLT